MTFWRKKKAQRSGPAVGGVLVHRLQKFSTLKWLHMALTCEVGIKDSSLKNTFVMHDDLKNFFEDSNAICPDFELHWDLVVYLT